MDVVLNIGKAAQKLGINVQTLRRWHKDGKLLPSYVSAGGHRYYREQDLERHMDPHYSLARAWAAAPKQQTPTLPSALYCSTQPVFQYRLEEFGNVLARNLPIEKSSLLVAIVGEIGNNSFDHNLGNWLDTPGIFFAYDPHQCRVTLADRGRGILATLKRVRPSLTSHAQALKVAFNEILSGRAPEPRGNGLKFVRDNVRALSIDFSLQTGDACWSAANGQEEITDQAEAVVGTLTRIHY